MMLNNPTPSRCIICPNCHRLSAKLQGTTNQNPMYRCRKDRPATKTDRTPGCGWHGTLHTVTTYATPKGRAKRASDYNRAKKQRRIVANMIHPDLGYVGIRFDYQGTPSFSAPDSARPDMLYIDYQVGRFNHHIRRCIGVAEYRATIK